MCIFITTFVHNYIFFHSEGNVPHSGKDLKIARVVILSMHIILTIICRLCHVCGLYLDQYLNILSINWDCWKSFGCFYIECCRNLLQCRSGDVDSLFIKNVFKCLSNVWLNDLVFLYKLSGCGFDPSCSDLKSSAISLKFDILLWNSGAMHGIFLFFRKFFKRGQ